MIYLQHLNHLGPLQDKIIMNSGQKVVEFEDIFYLPVLGFIGT